MLRQWLSGPHQELSLRSGRISGPFVARLTVRLQLRQAYPLKLEIRRIRSLVYKARGQKPCVGGLAGLNAVEIIDG